MSRTQQRSVTHRRDRVAAPSSAVAPAQHRSRADALYSQLNHRYTRYCAWGLTISAIAHLVSLLVVPMRPPEPYVLDEVVTPPPQVIDVVYKYIIPAPPKPVERLPLPETDLDFEIDPEDLDEHEAVPQTVWTEDTHVALGGMAPAPPRPPFQSYDRKPEPIHKPFPTYPELARMARAEGVVYVQVTIDESGRIVEAEVLKSDTVRSLQLAAVDAARRWLFRPAMQRDVPVRCRIVVPFRFSLH